MSKDKSIPRVRKSVRIPKDLDEFIEGLSNEEGSDYSDTLRRLLKKGIKRYNFEQEAIERADKEKGGEKPETESREASS